MGNEFSLEEVNFPEDESKMTDMEKKHYPKITCPDRVKKGETFEVRVETGKLLKHPNEYGHFIMWTELYADERFIGRTQFSPVTTEPVTCFRITLEKSVKLIAYSMCNLHGLWKSVFEVKVE